MLTKKYRDHIIKTKNPFQLRKGFTISGKTFNYI